MRPRRAERYDNNAANSKQQQRAEAVRRFIGRPLQWQRRSHKQGWRRTSGDTDVIQSTAPSRSLTGSDDRSDTARRFIDGVGLTAGGADSRAEEACRARLVASELWSQRSTTNLSLLLSVFALLLLCVPLSAPDCSWPTSTAPRSSRKSAAAPAPSSPCRSAPKWWLAQITTSRFGPATTNMCMHASGTNWTARASCTIRSRGTRPRRMNFED